METVKMQTSKLESNTNNISSKERIIEKNKDNYTSSIPESIITNNQNTNNLGKTIYNTGKEFVNMGMYMAEGKNFSDNRNFNRYNINKTRKEDFKEKNGEKNIIANMRDDDST